MQIHPELMHLVHTRGMSSHPSTVGARDQIHAHFLEHLDRCEVPRPKLDNRDRYLLIAAIDYAVVIATTMPVAEAQAYMATVIAALLLEAGFEVVLDDDDSHGTGFRPEG